MEPGNVISVDLWGTAGIVTDVKGGFVSAHRMEVRLGHVELPQTKKATDAGGATTVQRSPTTKAVKPNRVRAWKTHSHGV